MGQELRFLLNDTEIRLTEAGARDTLLDFLRLNRRMTGTRRSCAEGDYGACTVLVGRIHHGQLHYEHRSMHASGSSPRAMAVMSSPSNICAARMAGCIRCRRPWLNITAANAAFTRPVSWRFTSCGCRTRADMGAIETALQGNLCRCTDYEPIVKAAFAASGRAASTWTR